MKTAIEKNYIFAKASKPQSPKAPKQQKHKKNVKKRNQIKKNDPKAVLLFSLLPNPYKKLGSILKSVCESCNVVEGTKSILKKRSVRLYHRISPLKKGNKEIRG